MRLQITNYKIQTTRGFTLIETLVAITILLIGVLGPMTAATRGITDGLYSQNQITATHLAQEGLEMLVAQIENNNLSNIGNATVWLSGSSGTTNLTENGCLVVAGCQVRLNSGNSIGNTLTFVSCPASSQCQLAYNPGNGFYEVFTGGAGQGQVFTRTLWINEIDPATHKEAILKSKVEWFNKGVPKNIEFSRYIYNPNAF